MIRFAQVFLVVIVVGWIAESLAAPPSHAPAHGWRKKNDPYYVGYTGHQWERDFGISTGRCNRQEVGTVVGGVVGGVIGNKVADPEDRVVATIVGVAVGALIGNQIGRKLDEGDKSCFGHSLEVGKTGQPVKWVNDSTNVQYEMTPGERRSQYGDGCREFGLRATSGDSLSYRSGVACPTADGVWEIASTERLTSKR